MILSDLRREARFRLKDEAKPYFWSDGWIESAINEAEREACLRARLIEDNSSNLTAIDVVTTEKRYELSPLIIDVIAIETADGSAVTGWTLTESELVLDSFPSSDATYLMTVIRFPMSDASSSGSPEIRAHHHIHLLDWVEYRACSVQDADSFDPGRAAVALTTFEQRFGKRPDANVQRKQRRKIGRIVQMSGF